MRAILFSERRSRLPHALSLDEPRVELDLADLALGVPDPLDEALDRRRAEPALAHVHRGERGHHDIAQRHVVEADDRDIFRQMVSGVVKSFHRRGRNNVVIREVRVRELGLSAQEFHHLEVQSR